MSDIEKVREISMNLYDAVPLRECEINSLKGLGLVQHPYISNMAWYDRETKDIKYLYDQKSKGKCREYYRKAIHSANLSALFLMVRDSYKMTWFNLCKDYLTKEEYAEYLKASWTQEENPNQDKNVSRRRAVALFRKADKEKLMDKEEYSYYEKLPQEVTVWRGVSPSRERLGLSWTNDKDTATWFMKRFENECRTGYMLEATIDKEFVLAYINSRGEKELVVDVHKIKNQIKEVKE